MRFKKLRENLYNQPEPTTLEPQSGLSEVELFDSQISSQIYDLIKDKLNIIDKLNAFRQCILQANMHNEILPILDDIIEDDNKEVGNLQGILKHISTDAENIDIGEEEVEQILN